MRLTFTPTPQTPSESALPDTGPIRNESIEAAVAQSPSSTQGASIAKGNSLRGTLLGKYAGQTNPKRKVSGGSSRPRRLQDIATEALASSDPIVRELASALLPRDAVIGPQGLTQRQEQAAFEGFERPGFAAQESGNDAVQRLLIKFFGSIDALATAAIHSSAPLHVAARMVVERGYVPGNTPAGLSTVAAEVSHFAGMQRVGF